MLQVTRIDTYYDEFRVLKEISLSVSEGDLVLVFGPNGHGKSTLLKTISGLIKPSTGTIEFDGREIHHLPIDRIVAMGLVYIPEERHLFTEMTVLENLKLGAYNPSAWPKLQQSLEFVFNLFPRLEERKKQIVSTLSGGELRMLAIGRGLMAGAKFLAIDEPSLGLSPILTREVFRKIEEINRNNSTILLVAQNIKETAYMARRVYLMEDGRITFGGTKEEALLNSRVRQAFLGRKKA
ncbi:MAG: ABC transporter ATP-binding protein [Deltaproteobacteria bacterium]|nr:ABC transporter ATP-binding protein [Deltaproteobacteria bacterium]